MPSRGKLLPALLTDWRGFRISGSIPTLLCPPLPTRDPQGNQLRRLAYAVQDSGPRRRYEHLAPRTVAAIPEAAMMCQISISEDGDVTAIVDTESADDDEASRLAGLALDDMLARAAETAISTWFRIRTDEADGDGCDPQ